MLSWEGLELIKASSRGFVYMIINTTNNMLYIGKKNLITERRITVEGRKNKKIVRKPSNWKTYYGSSEVLTKEVRRLGRGKFRRVILGAFDNLHSNNYAETDLQFHCQVLSDGNDFGFKCYNKCIKINTVNDGGIKRDYIERANKVLKGL